MKKALPFVLLLLLLGCGPRLNIEKDVKLEVGQPINYTVDPVSRAQTIKVAVKANSGKVSIVIVLEKDLGEGEKAMIMNKATDKVIASQFKSDDVSLQVSVPANEAAVVMVAAAEGKAAEVKLKISN